MPFMFPNWLDNERLWGSNLPAIQSPRPFHRTARKNVSIESCGQNISASRTENEILLYNICNKPRTAQYNTKQTKAFVKKLKEDSSSEGLRQLAYAEWSDCTKYLV